MFAASNANVRKSHFVTTDSGMYGNTREISDVTGELANMKKPSDEELDSCVQLIAA